MRVGIRQEGLEAAKAQLASIGRSVNPVMRGTLDTTAVEVRRRRYVPAIAPMFKSRRFVVDRIVLKRVKPRKKVFDARLIPSSSSVYVTEYKRWGYRALDETRARISVGSFKGHKVVAGFVNPSSFARQPWRTRTERAGNGKKYRYESQLKPALGPSIAFYFKRMTNRATIEFANKRMEIEFQRRLRRELLKGPAQQSVGS